jgi:hypothetical protein
VRLGGGFAPPAWRVAAKDRVAQASDTNVGSSGIESRFPVPESHPVSEAEACALMRVKLKRLFRFPKIDCLESITWKNKRKTLFSLSCAFQL